MKRSELVLMVLQVPIDFLMLMAAGVSAFYLRFASWIVDIRPVVFGLTLVSFLQIIFPVVLVWLLLFAVVGLYRPDANRKLFADLNRIVFASAAGISVVALYLLFTQVVFDSRFLVAASWLFGILYISFGRLLMRGIKSLLYRRGIGVRRLVVIGPAESAEQLRIILRTRKELGYTIVATYPSFSQSLVASIMETNPDEVLFLQPQGREEEAIAAIEFCHDHHIVFKYSADLFATYAANVSVHPLAGMPVAELHRTPLEGWGRILKRLFDIIMSVCVIVLTSPLMGIAALGILYETGRPIIYKNERVGVRAKRFFTLKFRSMHQKDSTGAQFGSAGIEAEEREKKLIETQNSKVGPIYKIANDPRVTPFGRWLRRWSIDELPQFFNVLIGDMSIVGPRPHQPREVALYAKEYHKVFMLKPGITGLAQISGRSDLSFADEMRLDIFYIEQWSLRMDMLIFLKTPFILFKKRKVE